MNSGLKNRLVTAAIIRKGDKILVAKRSEMGMLPGKWEFPGGMVEEGEDPDAALAREIREELDIEIDVDEIASVIPFKTTSCRGDRLNLIILFYNCRYRAGTPRAVDCQDFRWVSSGEVNDFDLAPADREMAKKLTGQAS